MIYIWLNAVPITVATLAALLLGLLYARGTRRGGGGRRRGDQPGIGLLLLSTLALGWFAAILAGALILAPPQAPAWVMAIGSAIVIWAGFVLPVVLVSGRFRGVGGGAVLADALWWLVAMLLMAAIMQAWGLVPPPSPGGGLSLPPDSAAAQGSAPG